MILLLQLLKPVAAAHRFSQRGPTERDRHCLLLRSPSWSPTKAAAAAADLQAAGAAAGGTVIPLVFLEKRGD